MSRSCGASDGTDRREHVLVVRGSVDSLHIETNCNKHVARADRASSAVARYGAALFRETQHDVLTLVFHSSLLTHHSPHVPRHERYSLSLLLRLARRGRLRCYDLLSFGGLPPPRYARRCTMTDSLRALRATAPPYALARPPSGGDTLSTISFSLSLSRRICSCYVPRLSQSTSLQRLRFRATGALPPQLRERSKARAVCR